MAGVPRAMLGRVAAVALVLAVIGVGLVGSGGTSAEPTVQAFLLAWAGGQYRTAAGMTLGRPAAVVDSLKAASLQLDAANWVLQIIRITQDGDSATAVFRASVDLGSSGLPWTYQGRFGMRRTGGGWKVVWSPAVIVPGLRSGDRLAVLTAMPRRAQLQDSRGQSLAAPSHVYVVGVRPGRLANQLRTADEVARLTQLQPSQVYGQIIAAPSNSFLSLLRLRPSGYARLRTRLSKIPGVIVVPRTERLFDSIAPAVTGTVGTETASVLRREGIPYRPGTTVGLTGLQAAYQHTLTGSGTTEVVLQNAAGRQVSVLARWAGDRGTAVRTTISRRTQLAADQALANLPASAAIVAVQPGTGRILAAATHQAAGLPAVSPLAGKYRPGQVFSIVSTAALVQHGFSTSVAVPCRAENTIGGVRFSNHPAEPRLGKAPPFSVDFAHACGTAIAGLSLQLDSAELASAAQDFGIGAGWQLPVASYQGTIGRPSGEGSVAATMVGGEGVRVSPLDMALTAGLVQSGAWHAPSLVAGAGDPSRASRGKLSVQVVSSLRELMRATVAQGAASAANVPGVPVYGQVGSSAFGSAARHLRSAWFVGYQGDVAFAVVELAKSPQVSAASLAGAFLQDLQAPP